MRCNSGTNPSCISDATYNSSYGSTGSFIVDVPIVQYNVNPSSQKYKEIYIEDSNYFMFTSQLGLENHVYIEQGTIITDMSIMPYSNKVTQTVTRVPKAFQKDYILTQGQPMSSIIFKKSSQLTKYVRSFNKVDAYLSYVGGLVGTIITLVFFMGKYTEKAYEVSICKKVLVDNERKVIPSGSFNLIWFLVYYVKWILNLLGFQPNWPQAQQF